MAEGDTVLRAARRLDRALRGEAIAAEAPNPRGRAVGVERLDGRVLEAVGSHGKHLLLDFGDLLLHSHLGMNGSWQVHGRGERWRRPRRTAWAVLSAERAEAAQFGGPTLRILTPSAARVDPVLSRLGPDLLSPDFEPAASIRLFGADRSRELGDALLDQRLVAGIGNIFKSEACFEARLNPWAAVGDLSEEQLTSVLEVARQQMFAAVESGRHPHRVYRRRGAPCQVCGTPIRSAGQGDADRTTYWCPSCQAAPGAGVSRTAGG